MAESYARLIYAEKGGPLYRFSEFAPRKAGGCITPCLRWILALVHSLVFLGNKRLRLVQGTSFLGIARLDVVQRAAFLGS